MVGQQTILAPARVLGKDPAAVAAAARVPRQRVTIRYVEPSNNNLFR